MGLRLVKHTPAPIQVVQLPLAKDVMTCLPHHCIEIMDLTAWSTTPIDCYDCIPLIGCVNQADRFNGSDQIAVQDMTNLAS